MSSAGADPAILDLGPPGTAVARTPYDKRGVGEMLKIATRCDS
ncbi:MAG TPA: hypothetical protein VFF32_03530 [Dermatophilaceae bacterium]|nr:hypothetical protein [Dermatophilaceae bacterium]